MKEEVPYSGFESYFYNTAQDAGEMNGDFDADGHILKEECSVDFDSSAREEAQLNIFDNSQRNIQKLFREIQDKIQLFLSKRILGWKMCSLQSVLHGQNLSRQKFISIF